MEFWIGFWITLYIFHISIVNILHIVTKLEYEKQLEKRGYEKARKTFLEKLKGRLIGFSYLLIPVCGFAITLGYFLLIKDDAETDKLFKVLEKKGSIKKKHVKNHTNTKREHTENMVDLGYEKEGK